MLQFARVIICKVACRVPYTKIDLGDAERIASYPFLELTTTRGRESLVATGHW